MNEEEIQEQFTMTLDRNLRERKRLSKQNVQKLYSRRTMEQGFLECFELIGGVPRLAIWANEPDNYGEFLKLLMKFAPKDGTEKVGSVIQYTSNVPPSPLNRSQEVAVLEKDEGGSEQGHVIDGDPVNDAGE